MAATGTGRKRPHVTMTVHKDTIGRLDDMAARFQQSRGQVLDRLVNLLWMQYKGRDGKPERRMCLNGEPCSFNRTDVPEVF